VLTSSPLTGLRSERALTLRRTGGSGYLSEAAIRRVPVLAPGDENHAANVQEAPD
jgi:hypothetical protein